MVTETWSTFNCVKPFSECAEKKSWYEALRKERTRPSRGTAGSENFILLRAERKKQPDKRIGSCTAGSSLLEFSNAIEKKNLGLTSGKRVRLVVGSQKKEGQRGYLSRGTAGGEEKYLAPGGAKTTMARGSALVLQVAV